MVLHQLKLEKKKMNYSIGKFEKIQFLKTLDCVTQLISE